MYHIFFINKFYLTWLDSTRNMYLLLYDTHHQYSAIYLITILTWSDTTLNSEKFCYVSRSKFCYLSLIEVTIPPIVKYTGTSNFADQVYFTLTWFIQISPSNHSMTNQSIHNRPASTMKSLQEKQQDYKKYKIIH